MSKDEIQRKIEELVKEYFSTQSPSDKVIPLNTPNYGWQEVVEAMESMLSTYVTMGRKVAKFEEMFAEYIGVKHAIMVNSGSSANLIALSVLANPAFKDGIKPGDEVIVPATTWSTSVFPIINVGAVPVLVDVNLEDFNINIEAVKKAISPKTRAIMAVHLLGNPADMTSIMEIAREHNLFVIEDTCEAHGAEHKGKRVGGFGDLATFSSFFAHHINTIEGGMVVTNNDEYSQLAKILRAHGWVRDLKNKEEIAKDYPRIDKRFLFVNMGYNLRPTELQGAFGIHQMPKLERTIEIRRNNGDYWTKELSKHSRFFILPPLQEQEGDRRSWFCYPLIIKETAPFSRKELTDFLEQKGIETRPIAAGNIAEQPAMELLPCRIAGSLSNSENIVTRAFFFGDHQDVGEKEREYLVKCFDEFLKTHGE